MHDLFVFGPAPGNWDRYGLVSADNGESNRVYQHLAGSAVCFLCGTPSHWREYPHLSIMIDPAVSASCFGGSCFECRGLRCNLNCRRAGCSTDADTLDASRSHFFSRTGKFIVLRCFIWPQSRLYGHTLYPGNCLPDEFPDHKNAWMHVHPGIFAFYSFIFGTNNGKRRCFNRSGQPASGKTRIPLCPTALPFLIC